jgi:hypothetical protein
MPGEGINLFKRRARDDRPYRGMEAGILCRLLAALVLPVALVGPRRGYRGRPNDAGRSNLAWMM